MARQQIERGMEVWATVEFNIRTVSGQVAQAATDLYEGDGAAAYRRRVGELTGGAEGARAIAEADAWLAGQGVRAPERLARVFVPDMA